jgi:hypothetical protein
MSALEGGRFTTIKKLTHTEKKAFSLCFINSIHSNQTRLKMPNKNQRNKSDHHLALSKIVCSVFIGGIV